MTMMIANIVLYKKNILVNSVNTDEPVIHPEPGIFGRHDNSQQRIDMIV